MMTTTRAADQAAVRAILAAMEDDWNRGDGTAYGACFTADASYTAFLGDVYRGRDDIAAGHQALFDTALKGTVMFNEIVDIRFYGPDTAVVLGRGDVGRKRPRKLSKVQTYTLVRQADGGWLIAAFHNTQRKPLLTAISHRLQPKSIPLADR